LNGPKKGDLVRGEEKAGRGKRRETGFYQLRKKDTPRTPVKREKGKQNASQEATTGRRKKNKKGPLREKGAMTGGKGKKKDSDHGLRKKKSGKSERRVNSHVR